jgi:hypothetical protein
VKFDGVSAVGLVFAIILAAMFAAVSQTAFPFHLFGNPATVIDPSIIYEKVSYYLWNVLRMDAIIVAAILFASAISCIALLRRG